MLKKFKKDYLSDPQYRRTKLCSKYSDLLRIKDSNLEEYSIIKLDGNGDCINYILRGLFLQPFLVDSSPESIGMKLPEKSFTLEDAARLMGENFSIKVIEVGTQQQLENWTIGGYARYFHQRSKDHKLLNLISLECSNSPLGNMIQAPQPVQELDWIELYWPRAKRAEGIYPQVQKYCLAGMGGAYTDFHIDFGGTSVWYHILWGQKRFYLIPPSTRNLAIYLDWACSKSQDSLFLGDLVAPGDCKYFDLLPGQTLMLPAGWIHAVYTPVDSMVFGGNYLLSPCIFRQLQVYAVELRSQVSRMYRFPHYLQMCWYALSGSFPRAYEAYISNITQDTALAVQLDWLDLPDRWHQSCMIRQWAVLIRCAESWLASVCSEDEPAIEAASENALESCGLELPTGEPSAPQVLLRLWWKVLHWSASIIDGGHASDNSAVASSSPGFASTAEFVVWVRGASGAVDGPSTQMSWRHDLLDPELAVSIGFDSPEPPRESGLTLRLIMSEVQGSDMEAKTIATTEVATTDDRTEEDFEFDEEGLDDAGYEDAEATRLVLSISKDMLKAMPKAEPVLPSPAQTLLVLKVEKSHDVDGQSCRRVSFINRGGASPEDEAGDDVEDGKRYKTRGRRLSASYLQAVTDADVCDSDDEEYIDENATRGGADGMVRRGDDTRYFDAEGSGDAAFVDMDDDEEEQGHARGFKRRKVSEMNSHSGSFKAAAAVQLAPAVTKSGRLSVPASRRGAPVSVRQALMKKLGLRR